MMNRKKKFSAVSIALWFLSGICTAEAQILPYPESPVVTGISFDFSTHERHALGSDNWPVTWANDNHQYTSWGDGGGFGGTNTDGRVSLGVARVEGDATSYVGINVWGGKNSLYPATFGGKSYGILALGNTLYMWVSPGSNTQNYEEARLYRSTDGGASWSGASWAFSKNDGLILPTFLQFGKGYQGARDEFVYIYANHLKDSSSLKVQKPGEIALIRVHKNSIMDRSAYQFFSGFDGGGNPLWTNDIKNRVPVFMDPNGVGWNVSVSYNKGLNRYFLITEHETSMRGKMGVFDAPEPWGPWTTVAYMNNFGSPHIESSTFFWNFSNKWLSVDGKEFVLVFTGVGSNDSWNTVRGTFMVSPTADILPPASPKALVLR